ncbi:hypothetical protein [Conservatibacter flavescens]|uniref:Phage tail protein n=1 Tax=Conservatibacter flavescens TaxID=28161 RepID=A0A2M8S5K3_9PAST|nr:hypothetical protein [Conservatibacter flavescens]PJG86435.1 hypothetical protein CVP05_01085 [Conservatibacter flavescens]
MTIGTRETLLAKKPKLTQITIDNETYHLRKFTVGEMNNLLFGQQQEMIKLAEQQGIELDFDNEETLTKQLAKIHDPHRLARTLAMRLCDKEGNNLFDVNNPEDLTALSQLDKSVFEQLNKAIAEQSPKNSTPDASSK